VPLCNYCKYRSGRKAPEKNLQLFLEIFKFDICLTNIPQLQGALSPRPEALDTVKAQPRALCIGSINREKAQVQKIALERLAIGK